jgi:hypothetical protein
MYTAEPAVYQRRCNLNWASNTPESVLQTRFQTTILIIYPVIKNLMKPGNAPLQSIRHLDQVRERIRYMHYSLSIEKTYLHWVEFFVRWHRRKGVMRYLRIKVSPIIVALGKR